MCHDLRRARTFAPLLLAALLPLAACGCATKPITQPDIALAQPGGGGGPALRVLEVTPRDGSIDVSMQAPHISALMSWVLDASTVNDSTLTLTGEHGRVTGTVTLTQGAILAFVPSTTLESGTWYTARVRAGVRDENGHALAYDREWSFWTEDVLPPRVVSVSPPDSATQVATGVVWTATFSEGIDPASVAVPATVHVSGPRGDVAGTASLSSDLRTLTFTPAQALEEFETRYTVALGAIRDFTGNALAGPGTYRFTTVVADPSRLYYLSDMNGNRLTAQTTGASVKIDYPQAIPAQAWRFTSRGDGMYEIHSAALAATWLLDGGDGGVRASMQDGAAPSRAWRLTRLGSGGSVYLLSLPETLGERYTLGTCFASLITICMGETDAARPYLRGWTLARVSDQASR